MADSIEQPRLAAIEQKLIEAIEEARVLRDEKPPPSRDHGYYDGMLDAYRMTLAVVRGQSASCF